MATKHMLVTTMLLAALTIGGCLSSQAGNLLPAPSGTDPEAARHNQEGVEWCCIGREPKAKRGLTL